jgi:hypothetical protein
VVKAGKYGFVNNAGALFVPCIYDQKEGPFNGMWMAGKGGKYGYVNGKGFVVPCIYEEALYKGGIFRVQKDGKWGMLDKSGKPLLACAYDDIADFKTGYYDKSPVTGDDLAKVKKGGKYGAVNGLGKLVVPVMFDDVDIKNFYSTETKLVKVKKGELWGIADLEGKLIAPCVYEKIYGYQSGMCKTLKKVNSELAAVFLDKNGEEKFSIKDWYQVKDYFDGDYVEYNPGSGSKIRIDKNGNWFEKKGDKWVEAK